MTEPQKQMHLAAHFPGVNNTTVWSDPAAGSHIEFSSFAQFAQTAERGKFDFLFLAEGLRLREQNGEIYDLDVVGRPAESMTYSAAFVVCAGRDEAEIAKRAAAIGRDVEELRSNSPLAGTPNQIADQLGPYAEIGLERVYLQLLDMSDLEHLRLFADEVQRQL